MIRGLYIAASSAISENKRIDVIANNIANVNTSGFKKDSLITESFPEVLIKRIGPKDAKDLMSGTPTTGNVDFESNGGLYYASAKSGFFNVQTVTGIDKSKSIRFTVNDEGYVTTPQGDYVLGLKGPIYAGGKDISINEKGEVLSGGTVVDRLKVSNPVGFIGNMSYGVHADEVYTSFEQGSLAPSSNPLDIAFQGKGFFAIETPKGERYTRNGEFTLDAEGYVTTKEGYRVLGQNGYIQIQGKNITINENGKVFSDENEVDTLKLVDFMDYKLLQKEGDALFADVSGDPQNMIEAEGLIQQGFTEASNVNSVKQMVEMITVLRSYEANQKVIRTHDDLLQKAANDIGRL